MSLTEWFEKSNIEKSQQMNMMKEMTGILKYSKTCLNRHSKIDETKALMTVNWLLSLMKVKSIAECSLGAFCNTFDLHKQ